MTAAADDGGASQFRAKVGPMHGGSVWLDDAHGRRAPGGGRR